MNMLTTMPEEVLVSVITPGNLRSSCEYLNKRGWAEYLIQFQEVNEFHTLAILRVPAALAKSDEFR